MTAGRITILTGPPGAGKSTLARRLAETAEQPAVHLVCDRFFEAIRSGFIAPWLPASHDQNRTITAATAAAARVYALGGYWVLVDGIVGPWFLDEYRRAAAGLALDYIVLRLPREVAVARARDRAIGPLPDYPPHIFEGLSDLGDLESHAFEVGEDAVDIVAARVLTAVDSGRWRLRLGKL